MANKPNRHKSRAIAMEILYSGEVNHRDGQLDGPFLEEFIDLSQVKEPLDEDYIKEVVALAEAHREDIKREVEHYLSNRTYARISRINQAILSIAISEIRYMSSIPEKVSLNEALQLAKEYSDEDSVSFINGILDKVMKNEPPKSDANQELAENTLDEVANEERAAEEGTLKETSVEDQIIKEDHIVVQPEEKPAEDALYEENSSMDSMKEESPQGEQPLTKEASTDPEDGENS